MKNTGKLKEYCEYTATGELKRKDIYQYDENGNIVEVYEYKGEVLVSREIYVFFIKKINVIV